MRTPDFWEDEYEREHLAALDRRERRDPLDCRDADGEECGQCDHCCTPGDRS